jgi:hypothetical protein
MGTEEKFIWDLVGKPEGPLGKPGCRWEDNIKADLVNF